MHKVLALFLALGAVVVQVHAVDTHVIDTLEAAKLGSFKSLVDLSGATAAFQSEDARITILAPTDEAVAAFLTEMGLTMDDLKADENLVDKIVAYHTVLGITAGPAELFANSKTVLVPTASAPFKVQVTETADGVTVTDFQGNVANIVSPDLGRNNHRVHAIDKVLFSGGYWTDLSKLIGFLPDKFSTVAKAAEAAGLASTLTAQSFASTIFLPTNEAFEKSGVQLDAPAATIAEILRYHVVDGDRTIPEDFTAGAAVTTLEGQDITVTFVDTEPVAGIPAQKAIVTDAVGGQVEVVQPNIHISKGVSHVIDGVLMPKMDGAAPAAEPADTTTTSVAVEAPAAATTAAPAAAVATVAGKGNIFQIFQALWPFKRDGMRVTINFADGSAGRKLLQNSRAVDYTSALSLAASEQAILSAVNSNSLYGTANAARQGQGNAQLATQFPTNPTWANGINQFASYGTGGN